MTDENSTQPREEPADDAERRNPAENTAPPSNPEVEPEAVEQGKEKLDRIVNW